MTWITKYHTHPMFLAHFDTEQEFVDAMFIQIVMFNYSVWLKPDKLYEHVESGANPVPEKSTEL